MKKHYSFTLIELLSVIFIIVLLMGILVPAMGLVRNTVIKLSCKNSISELAKTTIECSVSQENDGNFPGPAIGKDQKQRWDYKIAEKLNLAICNDFEDSDAVIEAKKFFTCTKDPNVVLDPDKPLRSYALNLGENEVRPTLKFIDQSTIRSPADTILFYEMPLKKSTLFSTDGNYAHPVSRLLTFLADPNAPGLHNKTDGEPEFSIVFFDGSASTILKRKDENFKQSANYRLFLYDKRK